MPVYNFGTKFRLGYTFTGLIFSAGEIGNLSLNFLLVTYDLIFFILLRFLLDRLKLVYSENLGELKFSVLFLAYRAFSIFDIYEIWILKFGLDIF